MEAGTWNVGTVVWVAFGVLLLWGLAAALWSWLLDLPEAVAKTPRQPCLDFTAADGSGGGDGPNPG